MADTLRIKRRAVGGAAGAPASLAAAEIAYNEVDDKLYYGKGNSGGLATSIIPIGGPGLFGTNIQTAFRANKNGVDQTGIPNAVLTKLTFPVEDYDQGSYYDTTLSRWTPPAGLVTIYAGWYCTSGGGFNELGITKNGVTIKQTVNASANTYDGCYVYTDDIANGSDYYEVVGFNNGTSATASGNPVLTYFGGHCPVGPPGPQGAQGLSGSVTAPAINCGRLTYVSTTSLAFKPYNGDRIKINGTLYAIPAAGIAGLASTTSVFVNGVAGQSLATQALCYVYAFDNGGVVTADFRTASTNPHSPSTTAGNVGTEILTGNDTRTLIGMIYMAGGNVFALSPAACFVLSWFNRRSISVVGTTADITTGSTGWVELSGSSRAYFLAWADEAYSSYTSGMILNTNATHQSGCSVGGNNFSTNPNPLTGGNIGASNGGWMPAADAFVGMWGTDNLFYVTPMGVSYNGTASRFVLPAGAITRG